MEFCCDQVGCSDHFHLFQLMSVWPQHVYPNDEKLGHPGFVFPVPLQLNFCIKKKHLQTLTEQFEQTGFLI